MRSPLTKVGIGSKKLSAHFLVASSTTRAAIRTLFFAPIETLRGWPFTELCHLKQGPSQGVQDKILVSEISPDSKQSKDKLYEETSPGRVGHTLGRMW